VRFVRDACSVPLDRRAIVDIIANMRNEPMESS
jgi:hypothetical protein